MPSFKAFLKSIRARDGVPLKPGSLLTRHASSSRPRTTPPESDPSPPGADPSQWAPNIDDDFDSIPPRTLPSAESQESSSRLHQRSTSASTKKGALSYTARKLRKLRRLAAVAAPFILSAVKAVPAGEPIAEVFKEAISRRERAKAVKKIGQLLAIKVQRLKEHSPRRLLHTIKDPGSHKILQDIDNEFAEIEDDLQRVILARTRDLLFDLESHEDLIQTCQENFDSIQFAIQMTHFQMLIDLQSQAYKLMVAQTVLIVVLF